MRGLHKVRQSITWHARDVPNWLNGLLFPAAMSPLIWWKWLQNSMLVVVKPTTVAADMTRAKCRISNSLADVAAT